MRFPALLIFAALAAAAPAALADLPAQPVEQWRWDGNVDAPGRPNPLGSPLVVQLSDDDGDGRIDARDTPDVLFLHFGSDVPSGAVTALDGATGDHLFTITHPPFSINNTVGSPLAAGDVDGDGLVEIVVSDVVNVLVFENDGSFGWSRPLAMPAGGDGMAIGIADLDQDGVPEITLHAQAVSADGSLSWAGTPCFERTCSNGYAQVADVRPDVPGLEMVTGNTCYDARGNVLWTNADVPMGATVIGDLDGDAVPEIVLVGNTHGSLHVLDPFGNPIGPAALVPGTGTVTHPILADLDGDGLAEVAVPCGDVLQAYDWQAGALVPSWSAPIVDSSCCSDGIAYDFDGDAQSEIVYRDEQHWLIIGCGGRILSAIPSVSATAMESPVVANIDGDPAAEVIVTGVQGTGANVNAVVAYEVPGSVTPRAIWNQKTYHVTNVHDDGTIPRVEQPAWLANESWHAQLGPSSPRTFELAARATDLSPCSLGIRVEWGPALLAGAPASVTYDVHRSDAGGGATCADALARPPLASGLTALEWLDVATHEDRLHAYVVVARSVDPCGPAATPACTPPVTDLGTASPPDMLGWPLRARHAGHEVTFAWPLARPLLAGEHFHLKRALDSPVAPFEIVNGEGSVAREHVEIETRSRVQFFDLRVANACEDESGDDEPPSY